MKIKLINMNRVKEIKKNNINKTLFNKILFKSMNS
jgi:hypothetical protein